MHPCSTPHTIYNHSVSSPLVLTAMNVLSTYIRSRILTVFSGYAEFHITFHNPLWQRLLKAFLKLIQQVFRYLLNSVYFSASCQSVNIWLTVLLLVLKPACFSDRISSVLFLSLKLNWRKHLATLEKHDSCWIHLVFLLWIGAIIAFVKCVGRVVTTEISMAGEIMTLNN
jgi:hypothetical protein